jgi:hypothetical protein
VPGPAGRPLLGERNRAFLGVVGAEHRHQDLVLLGELSVRAPAAGFDDDPLGGGHGQRTVDGDPLGQIDRRVQRAAGFGKHVDHAQGVSPLGSECLPRQRQLHRDGRWDTRGQPQQPTAAGHQPALDLGNAERRVPGRHDQVGRQRQLGAAGQRVALNCGDERLVRPTLGEAHPAALDDGDFAAGKRLEVHAGAERSTRPGHDAH